MAKRRYSITVTHQVEVELDHPSYALGKMQQCLQQRSSWSTDPEPVVTGFNVEMIPETPPAPTLLSVKGSK